MNLLYVHSEEIGYGRMGVKMAEAIERAGVEIFDDLPNPKSSGGQKFIPYTNGKSAICEHAAWLSTPGHCRGWWEGQSRSILTMWESDKLPEPFRANLDSFDTIVVPSQQNKELFSQFHRNVKYVPLGLDPKEWFPTVRPTLETPYFTFFVSGGGYRKGSDLVIKAFQKVFDSRPASGPAPRLFIHSARSSETPKDERIHLLTGKLDPAEERALYSMAHVYVQPSRGEGFGLRPLQAIAQGCVTIATNAHGHAAFGGYITYPINAHKVETPAQAFHHGPAGSWWEPDFDELCEAMEDSYANYATAVRRAQALGTMAAQEFTWDQTAAKYLKAIGALSDRRVEPTKWITPAERMYLVRVRTSQLFEVGGVQYMLEPGRDYWEPADVKRVLFDGGNLELNCLPPDLGDNSRYELNLDRELQGLTAEQLSMMGEYSGRMALCPTCHQMLNTNDPTLEYLESLPMPQEA